jgi:hypothetical protein
VQNHLHIKVDKQTSATEVISFLRQARALEATGRKFKVRALEKTYVENGKTTTVKILFVRSGRENPLEWFSNLWNRKRQYALASKTLSYGLTEMPRYACPMPAQSTVAKDLREPLVQAGIKYKDRGVPVSIFSQLFA